MTPALIVLLVACVAGIVWLALSADRLLDRTVMVIAGAIGRRAGAVAASAFLLAAAGAVAWGSVAG